MKHILVPCYYILVGALIMLGLLHIFLGEYWKVAIDVGFIAFFLFIAREKEPKP